MGPRGLDALWAFHDPQIETLRAELVEGAPSAASRRLRSAIEAVSRQRDAHASRLFWFTDWEAAVARAFGGGAPPPAPPGDRGVSSSLAAAAKAERKPILSLRLLGNLDEEASCANSRFFRTVLYANHEIGNRLRADWILHWESVRPVPLLKVDFGDGRVLERTVTGNSLHYVLTPEGEPVDVLPGLLSPRAFLCELEEARRLALDASKGDADERRTLIARAHAARLAAPATHDEAVLDESSRRLMRAKTAGIVAAADFERLVDEFERSIARDSDFNRQVLRRPIDVWFASEQLGTDLATLTARIYDEVFLTPRSDPWLGLLPANTYSALEGDGRSGYSSTSSRAPTDDEVRRTPPPSAREAGYRAGVKARVEMPAVLQILGAARTPSRPS